MLVGPMVERELRVQARARSTYWLRVFAGLAAAGALGACLMSDEAWALFHRSSRGPWLFALLHSAISVFFALTCPLICVDTVAGERRQGTLGILLLTPLAPASIITGKMAVHLIRVFAMWLAIVPVLAIPMLMGGIGPVDVTFALLLELGVVLGSLAAGLIASALTENPGAGIALAMSLTFVIGEALAFLSFLAFWPSLLANPNSEYAKHVWITATFGPWCLGTGLIENGFSGVLGRNPPWVRTALQWSLAAVVGGSLTVITLAWWLAVYRVKRLGHFATSTARQLERRRYWLQPVAAFWHKRSRERLLLRNPAWWLYTNRAVAGLGRWAWCGFGVLTWLGISLAGFGDNDLAFFVFAWPVALVVALGLGAAAALRSEIEDRSVELLLVTPLRPAVLVQGRLMALWRDFLPALLLATGLAVFWMRVNDMVEGGTVGLLVAIWSSFVAMPIVGLRMAIRRVSPVLGWGLNLLFAAGLPALFAGLAAIGTEPRDLDRVVPGFAWRYVAAFVPVQLAVAGFCAWCTITDLETRRFQLKPFQRLAC